MCVIRSVCVCRCFDLESSVIHSLHSGMERHCCHGVSLTHKHTHTRTTTHTHTETHSDTQAVVMLCYMEPWSHYLALDPTHSFTYTAFSVDFLHMRTHTHKHTHAHTHTHTHTHRQYRNQWLTWWAGWDAGRRAATTHKHKHTHTCTHSGPADKLFHARLIWFTVLSEHR